MIKFKCPECGNPMNSLMHECLECGFPIECLQLEEDTNELQTKTAEIERLKDYIERNQLSFEQVEAQRKNLETEVIFLKTQLSKYEKIEDCKQKEKNRADISERRCKELELKIQQLEEKLEEVGSYKNVSEEQAIELKNEIQELEKAEAIINSDALNNISCENCGEKLTEDTACYDFAHQTEKKTHSKHKFLSKKNKYWLFLLLIVSVIIIFFSKSLSDKEESKQNIGIDLFDSEEKKINNLIEQFVLDLSKGDLEHTQEFFDVRYNYIDENPYFLEDEETIRLILQKTTITVKDINVDTKSGIAYVEFEVTHPDYADLLDAYINSIDVFSNDNPTEDEAFIKRLNSSDLKYLTDDATLNLKQIDEEWKIINDDYLSMFMSYGATEKSSFTEISNNEQESSEEDEYISKYMELTDYDISECEGYFGTVPGIKNISLKNNGDKAIDSVTLYLDFFDSSGNIIVEKTLTVLGSMDSVLESGYSWKLQDDKFYEIDNLPNGTDLGRVKVGIKEVSFSRDYTNSVESEEEKYVREYLSLMDYKVGIFEGYLGKAPGIMNIAIKNNGNRNLSNVTVTVYFQDASGRDIAEDSFMVIGSWENAEGLKANYSWKMPSDKFYEIENLADEVDVSRHRVEITKIEFE